MIRNNYLFYNILIILLMVKLSVLFYIVYYDCIIIHLFVFIILNNPKTINIKQQYEIKSEISNYIIVKKY